MEPTIQDLFKPNFSFGTLFRSDGEQHIVITDSANRMISLSLIEAYNLMQYLNQVVKVEGVTNEQEGSSESSDKNV